MAFAPSSVYPILDGGCFTECDCGHFFEYDTHGEGLVLHPDLATGRNTEYPHRVWVCNRPVNDSGWRYALVKKTVAYIVVDEDDTGRAVIEKWRIKNHHVYNKEVA